MKHVGQIRHGEGVTVFLMLSYSFLVMTSYNILKPITRSKFIEGLGAENIPYVQLAAGVMIGGIMLGYSWITARLPRRWNLPIIQTGIAGLLVGFWLLFRLREEWVSAAFYIMGLILGLLLISQFWILANLIYDIREAKRLFGFIGAGAPLGGIAGSLITLKWVGEFGSTTNLLLISAVFMSAAVLVVIAIILREPFEDRSSVAQEEPGAGICHAIDLLRNHSHLKAIALVISFAAVSAVFIDQQLNMAVEATMGQESDIARFLAGLQALTSTFSFLIQLFLTSRIHRFLGVGFALLILPVSFGSTATIMLLSASLWAPGMARIVDQTLHYTVDKTTREILFLPLPGDIKIRVKAFVDVSVDRFARGLAAVLILVLIKPWGLNFNWQQISYASLTIIGLWIFAALQAKRSYLESFHSSIEARTIKPDETPIAAGDSSTVEMLVEELALNDERRVMYAMDILESLDKKNLITPLILRHESPAVRIRALDLLKNSSPAMALQWLPSVRNLLADPNIEVREAAIRALAGMSEVDSARLVRPYILDENPRIAITAAMILTRSSNPSDRLDAENALRRFGTKSIHSTIQARKELASVLGYIPDTRFCRLLIPLLTDNSLDVAQEALHSVRHLGTSDFLFVPTLISLLRHPSLKASAREILVGYGQDVLRTLDYFLQEAEEDIEVRRQIPATVARIPCLEAADILMNMLDDPDGCVRFEALSGLERLRCRAGMSFARGPVEKRILKECERQTYYANFYPRLFGPGTPMGNSLLARALREKTIRGTDRIFRLLGLIFPWKDMAATRWSVESGSPSRAKALEYLDNLLPAGLRRRVLPVLDQYLIHEIADDPKRPLINRSDLESPMRSLIHDRDPVISATAIHIVGESRFQQYRIDLEHLLNSRHNCNPYVFGAAAYVRERLLQSKDPRHAPWTERLPAIEIAARLGRLPLFASISVDELFHMAKSGRQVSYDAGETICGTESFSDEYVFLMEGIIRRQARSEPEKQVEGPAPVNFEEVLTGVPLQEPVKAVESCTCFSLTLRRFRELLSGSRGLVEGILRMLCTHAPAKIADPVVRCAHPPLPSGQKQLKPTDKILLFESYPGFSGISREELLGVIAIASELRYAEGVELFGEMDPPALHAVVSGLVVIEAIDEKFPISASDGDGIGLYQMFSGIPMVRRAVCASDSIILRVEREDFLDLLLQRPELMRQILANLFTFSNSATEH
jgi:AAA family ATP:ADP antiporter